MSTPQLRTPNFLPPPFLVEMKAGDEPHVTQIKEVQDVSEDDNFSKGTILKYFPNQRLGTLKDRSGRSIFFSLNEMDLVGPKGKESIKEGLTVGYDLAHAGKNIHVKKMKVY